MQKYLIVAALILGSARIVAGQPNKAPGGKQQPAAQQQPTPVVENAPDKQTSSGANQPKPGSNPPARNAPVEGAKVWWHDPNVYLVLVGIITAGVIGWQSKETRKSAEAAESSLKILERQTGILAQSVETAKENIEMVISKERARLLIDLLPFRNLAEGAPKVQFGVRYAGTTEAFIDYAEAEATVSSSPTPDPAIFPEPWRLQKIISSQTAFEWLAVPVQEWTERSFFEVEAKTNFVHFYGIIVYNDVFGKKRETGFYYVWRAGDDTHGLGGWQKKDCKYYDQQT